ncbi:major paralogous domain-containing protein [Fibrobacter sp. UWT2]|uniref:FISUMP domain-containing protein n=1 Tax=Fibrobacter sp. UWT2 TaxID=1896224 RepID=UPI00091C43B2|nr:FISUMP domain-containing protein [Fibrobacter sp. UWT2]SHK65292.1 major paralogous domain-containing protein [Fibrobacter sp. UWT2]
MNYSKMAVQFVCKMAMPLALMFAACSTDEGNTISKVETTPGTQMGGSSEEPSVIAYENISLRGRAYYAPAKSETKPSLENLDASFPQDVFGAGGSVTLKELDSTTLEWIDGASYTAEIDGAVEDSVTGEMCPSNNGSIQFDSVSLNSPVVMLIATSDDISLRAILDLRDTNSFVVDALSHLKAYRLQKLVASGESFASAKIQVETETANMFGFCGQGTLEAADVREMLNEFPFELLQSIKEDLGKTGSIAGLSESTKESMRFYALRSYFMKVSLFPESQFERLDEAAVLFYQENLKKKQYLLSMLARVYGYDCTSANEGALVEVYKNETLLKCHEGDWELVDNRVAQLNVSSTMGTMIDSRDGQTYKTVKLEYDGISQTWMAENLNYVTEKSSCFRDDSSYCSVYGRMYSFFPLDSIYNKYASEEDCVADRINVWLAEYRALADSLDEIDPLSEDDSLRFVDEAHRLCKELGESPENPDNVNWSKVIDSLDVLNYNVCPEGWRIPSYEDWEALLTHVDYDLLHSANGDPVGFGLETLGIVRGSNGNYRMTIMGGASYLFTPRPTPEEYLQPGMPYMGDAIGMIYTSASQLNNGFLGTGYTYAMWSRGFVRCIKND